MGVGSDEATDLLQSDNEDIGRIETIVVGAAGQPSGDMEVVVAIRPRGNQNMLWITWTADSGVKETLFSEDDWNVQKKHNPAAKLMEDRIRFVPYGTKQALPLLGKTKVTLQCEAGKRIITMVYVMAGQTKNLLGNRAAVALGILTLKPKGKGPDQSQETFKLVHQPVRTNPAHYDSRHPLPSMRARG